MIPAPINNIVEVSASGMGAVGVENAAEKLLISVAKLAGDANSLVMILKLPEPLAPANNPVPPVNTESA